MEPPEEATRLGTADVEKGAAPLMAEMEKGRITILTLEMLRELVKDPLFEIQITQDEISDKSNGLSITTLVLQSSWFIIQCIARHVQGLDLTQLELATLAVASLNGITCLLWWSKPLGARAIVHVYLTRRLTDKERNVEDVSFFFTIQSFIFTSSHCSDMNLPDSESSPGYHMTGIFVFNLNLS